MSLSIHSTLNILGLLTFPKMRKHLLFTIIKFIFLCNFESDFDFNKIYSSYFLLLIHYIFINLYFNRISNIICTILLSLENITVLK